MIFSNANTEVKNFLRSPFHLSLKQVQWTTWEKTQKQNTIRQLKNRNSLDSPCIGGALFLVWYWTVSVLKFHHLFFCQRRFVGAIMRASCCACAWAPGAGEQGLLAGGGLVGCQDALPEVINSSVLQSTPCCVEGINWWAKVWTYCSEGLLLAMDFWDVIFWTLGMWSVVLPP